MGLEYGILHAANRVWERVILCRRGRAMTFSFSRILASIEGALHSGHHRMLIVYVAVAQLVFGSKSSPVEIPFTDMWAIKVS